MSIFKSYDIRGTYPDQINEEIIYKIGKAFVKFLACKTIVVGQDMRTSSPKLFEALVKGITEMGCTVWDIGLCSTPMYYFAVNHLNAEGGLMITASHNPGKYNGLKLVRNKAVAISGETGIKEIEELVQKNKFTPSEDKGIVNTINILHDYIEYVKTYANNIRDLKIVIDCGNGMAGLTITELLKDYPIKLIKLYDKLDGSFPNHEANPIKEKNLIAIKEAVIKNKADIGFAFDGDVDRLMIIDEKANSITGDFTTGIIAGEILKNRKEKIYFDPRSSKGPREYVEKLGGTVIVERVGHSHIKAIMRKQDIYFGGELSGHYFYKENFFTDSAAITMLKILSILSRDNKKTSELINEIPKYNHTGELNFEVENKDAVIQRVKEKYSDGKQSFVDGITVEYADWWFNLRKSNTEPVIRLNLEANTKELMEEKKQEVLQLIF